MKKIIMKSLFVLLMSVSIQANSASMPLNSLTMVSNPLPQAGQDDIVVAGMGSGGLVVQGEGTGFSSWTLDLASEGVVDFSFTASDPQVPVRFRSTILGIDGDAVNYEASSSQESAFSQFLLAGTYIINVFGTPVNGDYLVDIGADGIVNTPIPAASWLFGSAVIGFLGLTRRKKANIA